MTLHASASSARQWSALAAPLAPRFEVHAIDLHGHGCATPVAGRAPDAVLADEAALVEPILHEAGVFTSSVTRPAARSR